MRDAGVAQTDAQTFANERKQFIINRRKTVISGNFARMPYGDGNVGFGQDSDHAKCSPAQGKDPEPVGRAPT